MLDGTLNAFRHGESWADSTIGPFEDFEARILAPSRNVLRASWWIDNKDAEVEDIEELVSTAVTEDDRVETENPF